jgi:sugar phosphate isomerase/epimerase
MNLERSVFMGMRIGFNGTFPLLEQIAGMGYDYLEGHANALAPLSAGDFASLRRRVREAGIDVPSLCGLFPWKGFSLFERSDEAIRDYLERTFDRAADLGVSRVVFGSGGARSFPEGETYAGACDRLADVLRLSADLAAPCGISLLFEPLRRAETNLGNSLCEGWWFVRSAARPNLALLADYYHMATSGEPLDEIVRVGGIRQAHIATKADRRVPTGEGDDDFRGFFRNLHRLGTCDAISIEGGFGDAADLDRVGPAALALLRRLRDETLPDPE